MTIFLTVCGDMDFNVLNNVKPEIKNALLIIIYY